METAPYESCIACYKGDVTTAVAFQGEAEFIMAGIHRAAAISIEEAMDTFKVFAETELGCDPGKVPGGRVTYAVRLCTNCAKKTDTKVGRLPDDVPCYVQGEVD